MRKIFNIFMVMVLSILAFGIEVNAAVAPNYDADKDIFYANGTPITIGNRTGEEGVLLHGQVVVKM